MGDRAGENEGGEQDHHLAGFAGEIATPARQHEDRDGDREIGGGDPQVGNRVEGDEVGSPEEAIAVRHEACRAEKVLEDGIHQLCPCP